MSHDIHNTRIILTKKLMDSAETAVRKYIHGDKTAFEPPPVFTENTDRLVKKQGASPSPVTTHHPHNGGIDLE